MIGAILFAVLEIGGCTTLQTTQLLAEEEQEEELLLLDAEFQTWREGLQAFQSGDYREAMAIFEFLSESAVHESLCRKALYALAVTRIIQAQSADELEEALDLWECWSQQAPGDLEGEDPRMLSPFLEQAVLPGVVENNALGPPQVKKKVVYMNHLLNKDLVAYKNLLQAKEKEIDRLKSRLEARDREVRRLKHQIESLEAIHMKIQEKKKEISSQ